MSLEQYHTKRNFSHSPEPFGRADSVRSGALPSFVIQKHAATRLHYDFRLEIDGVYKSWAVPKGPSLDTHDRRLAVHVEDHPLEYGSFEGTIPKGEYGGGTVMVWDRGIYEPKEDIREGYEKGSMKFVLNGEKLQGGFALVRMKPREGERADNWLLIKERDEYVRLREEYDVTEARPESAASGRDMSQIAAEEASDPAPPDPPTPVSMPSRHAHRLDEPAADIPMQLARLADQAPEGDAWIHEVKYDGYRVRAVLDNGVARMLTRSGQDWTDRFEPIARDVARLPVSSAIIDGEIVVFGDEGVPDFSALQQALGREGDPSALTYVAFDLLELDGWDLRDEPLTQRKELLRELLDAAEEPSSIRYAEHITGGGPAFHEAACDLSLEGSVSKRGDRPYRPGRSADWQKVKCLQRQEFVVGGYTEPGGSRQGFGALLLGVYRDGKLVYAGRVGTGFTERELADLGARLNTLAAKQSSYDTPPEIPGKHLHWVRPEMVVEVRFQEWTAEGVIRHPSYVGLREDKPVTEVIREGPDAAQGTKPDPVEPSDPVVVAGVTISNPTKELFASLGPTTRRITKLDLVRYYEQVADAALVHLRDRPLTLVRCPSGHERGCFYQKHPDTRSTSSAIRTTQIVERNGTSATYSYINDTAGLVALAQLGVLEIHVWNSTVDDVERPDRIVFDLDPGPSVAWSQIANAARLLRDALGALGLTAFLKATGGKGVHLVVPIKPEHDYDAVRALARGFVDRIVTHDPAAFTAKMAKSQRHGRVFLDYLRNAHGATAVTPYSTRARAGAPVSVPLAWSELEGDEPTVFTMDDVIARLANQAEEPWADYETARTSVGPEVFSALGVALQEKLDERNST